MLIPPRLCRISVEPAWSSLPQYSCISSTACIIGWKKFHPFPSHVLFQQSLQCSSLLGSVESPGACLAILIAVPLHQQYSLHHRLEEIPPFPIPCPFSAISAMLNPPRLCGISVEPAWSSLSHTACIIGWKNSTPSHPMSLFSNLCHAHPSQALRNICGACLVILITEPLHSSTTCIISWKKVHP